MAQRGRRWLPIVVGVLVVLAMVGIAAVVVTVSWFQQNVEITRGGSPESASSRFDDIKKRFPDQRPILEFVEDERRPRLVPGIESRKNPGTVSELHVLAWDPDENALATLTIPLWLLRLKSGPIEFGEYVSGWDDERIRIDVEDLERYGPGIVFEVQRGSGERVLLSAQ
jgi:hypothetical protein